MITKNKRLVLHPQSSCILNIPQRQMKFTERPPHQTHKKKKLSNESAASQFIKKVRHIWESSRSHPIQST